MKKSIIISFTIIIFFTLQSSSQVKYSFESLKTEALLNDINDIEYTDLKPAIAFINKYIQQIKDSKLFQSNIHIFDSLIFIPIYNVQLKISNIEKDTKSNNHYFYYLELIKYKPINRIVIFNKQLTWIGTMYLLKDINSRDFAFICYKIQERITFSAIICFTLNEYPEKYISIIKKQINNSSMPIYFNINNFSEELFFIKNNSELMVIAKKKKIYTTEKYLRKKYVEKDILNVSKDTILKYIYKECMEDTTKASDVN